MLTEQQIHQFHTFGFLVLKNMLTEDELAIVNEEFDKGMAKKDKSELIAGARVQLNWSNLESHSPFTASLLEDKRIYGIAQQLWGEDVVGKNSQANHYAGNRSPWHPDVGPNIHGCKFVFYLSPVDAESGALRVIPGSHRPEFSDRIKKVHLKDNDPGPPEDPGLAVNEVPFCSCDSQPGDAVLFNYLLWHASWHGSDNRRMVSLQYWKNPKTPEEKEAMAAMASGFMKRSHEKLTVAQPYPEFWLSNPDNSPLRACWIEWLREWGFIESIPV